jgi:hypothetical protein
MVAETLVELETDTEVVDETIDDVLDGVVTLEQVAPPENAAQVPDKALALLKSSV